MELPEVEKLQLSDPGSSVEEQDESVDESELQKFRDLKDRMIQLDRAELDRAELGSAAHRDQSQKSVPPVETIHVTLLAIQQCLHAKLC